MSPHIKKNAIKDCTKLDIFCVLFVHRDKVCLKLNKKKLERAEVADNNSKCEIKQIDKKQLKVHAIKA